MSAVYYHQIGTCKSALFLNLISRTSSADWATTPNPCDAGCHQRRSSTTWLHRDGSRLGSRSPYTQIRTELTHPWSFNWNSRNHVILVPLYLILRATGTVNPTEAEDQDKAVAASRNSEHFPMQPVPETHTFFSCICKPYVHVHIYIHTHTHPPRSRIVLQQGLLCG